jgi:hypothetical protein
MEDQVARVAVLHVMRLVDLPSKLPLDLEILEEILQEV